MFSYRPGDADAPRPWLDAWIAAAYGERGFWTANRPADHFRTAASTSPLLAGLIGTFLADHPEIEIVVELGAGDGELLTALHRVHPDLRLFGVDLRQRPDRLPESVTWCQDRWEVQSDSWSSGEAYVVLATLDRPALLIACEWLDDLPCPIATGGPQWRIAQVDATGAESAGAEVGPAELSWLQQWAPTARRAEIGLTREAAWVAGLEALAPQGGYALMIDYGHTFAERPPDGTLTGYRAGQRTAPHPAKEVNLTAHVALDSLQAAGESAGAKTNFLISQRAAVARFSPVEPDAQSDVLERLSTASQSRALSETLGDHYWLMQYVPKTTSNSPLSQIQ